MKTRHVSLLPGVSSVSVGRGRVTSRVFYRLMLGSHTFIRFHHCHCTRGRKGEGGDQDRLGRCEESSRKVQVTTFLPDTASTNAVLMRRVVGC